MPSISEKGNISIAIAIILVAVVLIVLFSGYEVKKLRQEIRALASGKDFESKSLIAGKELNELRKIQHDVLEQEGLESKYRDIQLRTLMNQINPHFLYNTLEAIRGQALSADDMIVADMTETLSQFFRYCISQKGNVVTIEDEVRNVNVYLKILNFRMAGRFDFKYMIEDSSLLQCQIPKLTIQPLIENAFNHGIYNMKRGGELSLRIERVGDNVYLYVKDNGVGIPPDMLIKMNRDLLENKEDHEMRRGGIALLNINQRIRLMYGDQYGLTLFSTQGSGTTVQITLPVQNHPSKEI